MLSGLPSAVNLDSVMLVRDYSRKGIYGREIKLMNKCLVECAIKLLILGDQIDVLHENIIIVQINTSTPR